MFAYVSRHPVLARGALAALLLALTMDLLAVPSRVSPVGSSHPSLTLAAGRVSFASGGHPRRQGQGLTSGLLDQAPRVPSWAEIDASLTRHGRGSRGAVAENDGDANGGGPLQAEEWFAQQRAYPLPAIPTGARQRSLDQLASLRLARASGGAAPTSNAALIGANAAGAWQHVGDPGQSTGGTATWDGHGVRNEGTVAGRVTVLATDPTSPNTVYAGTAGGGVWKTTDGGQSWATTTGAQASPAIGALAIDPGNRQTVYAITGEGNYSDSYYGAGVLKSTDGGATWTRTGAALNGLAASKLVIDPNNSNVLYAAMGAGPYSADRQPPLTTGGGVYRSTDAGATWQPILQANSGGVPACSNGVPASYVPGSDVAIAGSGSNEVLYAALGFTYGDSCDANDIYSSVDGGQTWTALLRSAFPSSAGSFGRIALATTPADPNAIYAAVGDANPNDGNQLDGVVVSRDRGQSWAVCGAPSDGPNYQYNYDLYVAADPQNPNTVYLGGIDIYKSTDACGHWSNATNAYNGGVVHPDQHALVFAADGSLYAGNDGGVWQSADGGATWNNRNANLDAIQLYGSAVSAANQPLLIYRGAQDNSNSRYDGSGPWVTVVDGDGMLGAVDPTDVNTAYVGHFKGLLVKTTDGGATWTTVVGRANANDPYNVDKARVSFVAPFVMDRANPRRLLEGTYRVWESTDAGATWHPTGSGQDLTGGKGYLTALTIAPGSGTIYAGSNNGYVQISRDNGATWTNGASLPGRWVTSIAVSPANPAAAWAATSGFNAATPATPGHVFATTDGGATWHNVSGDLPDTPVNAVVADNAGTLYAGTDIGVFVSSNGGTNWTPLGVGLPNTPVFELDLRDDGTLYASTHGRGLWSLYVGGSSIAPTNTPPPSPTPSNTLSPTPSNTPVPTNTSVPPAPSNTPVPPVPSNTPVPPAPSNTPVPPAPAPSSTPVPPVPTATQGAASAPQAPAPTPAQHPATSVPSSPSYPTATDTPLQPPVSPHPHPVAPLLTLDLPQSTVLGGGVLHVRITTMARTRVTVTLQVTTTRSTFTGKGKRRRRVAHTIVLYTVTGQGTTGAHGHLNGQLRVTYKPSRPTQATLTVTVRGPRGATARTARVTIQPAPHHVGQTSKNKRH